jgi:integrase
MMENNSQIKYSPSRLIQHRGTWVVRVSIPRPIRHLFGNGKATNRMLSTGTTDEKIALSNQSRLEQEIYSQFDKAQADEKNKERNTMDEYARSAIMKLCTEFKYNRGSLPYLGKETPFNELIAFRTAYESFYKQVQDGLPAIEDWVKNPEQAQEEQHNGLFNEEQRKAYYGARRRSQWITSFWNDLITEAALEQDFGVPELPEDSTPKKEVFVIATGQTEMRDMKPYEKRGREQEYKPPTLQSIQEEWFSHIDLHQEKVDTRRKLKRGFNNFNELMGEIALEELKTHHLHDFIDKIVAKNLEDNKQTSRAYLIDNKWAVSNCLNWAVRKNKIQSNPFKGEALDTAVGKKTQHWLPYTKDDLKILFALDMPEHCRLVMQIMLMTGMRPDEAASLTWEQFNNTNYGFRYFALFDDTSTQDINVKNEQSKRLVPLHPQLVLPPKGEGYLFNFREAEGKRVTAMGQELKPFYDVIGHSRKRSHSFRRTLKIMLRDAGVSKEINDAITGHDVGDTSGKSYGGASLETRFEAISKLYFSFML